MSVSAGTSRARSSRPVYETKRTSCPASSHQTPTTWGMMLAKLGCMTWLQRASFGPPVIRSRMQTRRCLTGPPNRASLAGGVPLGWLRHDISGDHAGHDLAPGDPGELVAVWIDSWPSSVLKLPGPLGGQDDEAELVLQLFVRPGDRSGPSGGGGVARRRCGQGKCCHSVSS